MRARLRRIFSYNPRFAIFDHQFLQDQYRAVSLSFAVAHLCRARNDARRFGLLFLMDILGSPKRIKRTVSPFFAKTANFLLFPGVRLILL